MPLALGVITDWRDRGCPEPEPVDADLLKRLMDWLVCGEVGPEYVPMMLEEMGLDGADAREQELRSDPVARAEFPVVVIGAGQSGLLAAIRLQQAGIPFTVVEKNAGVGGTWWENTYPGARVDVGNHFYCYSFEPSDAWTEFFAQQPELQAYFQRVMEERGVERHTEFGVEVAGVHGDESLEALDVRDSASGETTRLDSGGLFIFIGADAETGWLPPEIALDERGFVLTGPLMQTTGRWELDRDPYLLETSVPGIFACGDVRFGPVKRVAAAVGEGSMSIAFVHQFLREAASAPA